MRKNRIHNLFFDIGNVLFFFNMNLAINSIASRLCICPATVYDEMKDAVDDFERGFFDKRQFYDIFSLKFGNRIGFEEFAEKFSNIFWPNLEILENMENLSKKFQLTIVSNTNELHIEFLKDRYGKFFEFFYTEVYSHEIGFKKPEIEFYKRALELSGTDISEVLYFDDLKENILAAESLGIESVLYNNAYKFNDFLN